MFKLLNAADRELGQCVVSLSHLVVLDRKKPHTSKISMVRPARFFHAFFWASLG